MSQNASLQKVLWDDPFIMKNTETFLEDPRPVPGAGRFDVVVCGGGPAGMGAALRAAREGARTLLVENHGCLGGVWTAGLLTWIIDHENKGGVMKELMDTLRSQGGLIPEVGRLERAFDPEIMKVTLEDLCEKAGVEVRLFTRVAGAGVQGGRLTHILTESKSGREAFSADVFVDATGDGDLAHQAGCSSKIGRDEDGKMQPMSLLAILGGIDPTQVEPFMRGEGKSWEAPKVALREVMNRGGHEPSYAFPSLFPLGKGLYQIMANHQYGVSGIDGASLTRATMAARKEIHHMVRALRSQGGAFAELRLIATAEQIGVREGRRIAGLQTVGREDLVAGTMGPTDTCRATFCVDIHAVDPVKDKGLGHGGVVAKPYGIPYGAQVARDVGGLLLAGRCISGDFYGHASYRVTGNAVALGEAAGLAAAWCAQGKKVPSEIDGARLSLALGISK